MAESQPTKRCARCKIEKSTADFHKNRANKDGLSQWCKSCNNTKPKDGPKPCRKCKQLVSVRREGLLCDSCIAENAADERKCTYCGIVQSVENYTLSNGYRLPFCKSCKRAYARKYRQTEAGIQSRIRERNRSRPIKTCDRCKRKMPRDSFRKNDKLCLECRSKVESGLRCCSQCYIWKPTSDFPGVGAYCNSCNNRKSLEQSRTLATIRWRKEYAARPDNKKRRQESLKKAKQTEQGKESIRRSIEKHKDKRAARFAVQRAARSGKIPRIRDMECEICGGQATGYHHTHDHTREHWFSIIAVCDDCHGSLNGAHRRAGATA